MIAIKKGEPNPGLVALQQKAKKKRLAPQEAFKTLRNPLKETIRAQMVKEQGGLCAYCMCRIPRPDVAPNIAPIVIEHFVARNPADGRDVGQGLDYNNLLAVCHGNRGLCGTHTLADLTCDAHRENKEIRKVNPVDPSTLTSIFYYPDGRIAASDPDISFDLVQTLNLNCPTAPLLSERKAALDALFEDIGDVSDEELPLRCKVLLDGYLAETTKKTPFVGALIWYLRDLVAKLTSDT